MPKSAQGTGARPLAGAGAVIAVGARANAAQESAAEQNAAMGNIEQVLDQMNTRMAVAEQDADSAMNSDQNMESLIKMVSKVMDTYEGF